MKKKSQVLTGPAAPTERNPASFNRNCPVCGWESDETIEGSSAKFAKCPKCGTNFDQPLMVSAPPAEMQLLNPQVIQENANMKKKSQDQAGQAPTPENKPVDKNALVQLLMQQGISPEVAQQSAEQIEQAQHLQTEKEKSQQPNSQITPVSQPAMQAIPTVMKPISKLKKALEPTNWFSEPGKQLGPDYDPPRLAEAGEDEEEIFEADEEDEKEEMTPEQAKELGQSIGIDWDAVEFTVEEFLVGFQHELEHGSKNPETDVTHDDPEMTAKIAWAHLKEDAQYYMKLDQVEKMSEKSEDEEDEEHEEHEGEEEESEEKGESKQVPRFKASSRKVSMTLREVREVMLPQLEEDFFYMEAALQQGQVAKAQKFLHDAYARFYEIRSKTESIAAPTPEKDTSFLTKIGL